jgi:hypothetical protein
VTWAEVKQQLGKNCKKQKLANGRPGFIYPFGNRQFCVIVDSAENVYKSARGSLGSAVQS